ncbi:hypothetical protein INT45_013149 [Circinella minor]|uniref:Kelch repeat protein n=1 Tax=Circinella minor TaxID=1195481 RepID=A0A8H7VJF8_9FUNG|nr:hypothetical protein INT45_013149 [Circinella minor]
MRLLLSILSVAFIGLKVFAITPQTRYGGDSVLLNRRLYYFGGRPDNRANNPSTIQDLIYLDITKSFDVSVAQSEWQGVQVSDSLTAERNYVYAMGVIPEEESIMIYGGAGSNIIDDLLQHTVMVYNATSNRWQSLPEPQGSLKQVWPSDVNPPFTREMNIYDFTASMWTKGPQLPANMNVRYRAPTTLVGKDLYYIGGMTANYTQTNITTDYIMIPMTEILIYHIKDSTWEIKQATGVDIPDPRILHTIAANTRSMTWTKQDPIGSGPGALYGHAAVFADNSRLLFVMFGVNNAGAVQNGFGVLDTQDWKWVDQYTSSYPPQDESGDDPSDLNSSEGLSSGAIAGIVVGCVAGVALIAAFCFIRNRRNRNGKSEKRVPDGEATGGTGRFKPEAANDTIPNATLSPLVSAETVPPYRGHIPNEIDPPIALPVQNTTNAQAAPRPLNLRPVKPDGE